MATTDQYIERLRSIADTIDQGDAIDLQALVKLLRGAATRMRQMEDFRFHEIRQNAQRAYGFPTEASQGTPVAEGPAKDVRLLSPAERLSQAAELSRERNKTYGNSFASFGPILMHYLGTMTIGDETTWGRLAVFILMLGKMDRYSRNFTQGGHPDSLNDLSVYAQMQAYVDDLAAEK